MYVRRKLFVEKKILMLAFYYFEFQCNVSKIIYFNEESTSKNKKSNNFNVCM